MIKANNKNVQRGHEDRAARIRAVKILSVILFVDACLITQYMAWTFHFHPALGWNFFHFYPPWDCFVWAAKWMNRYPDVFAKITDTAILITAGSMLPAIFVYSLSIGKLRAREDLYGSARWSEWEDIKQAGLLSEATDSVVVGAFKDKKGRIRYLRHSGPEHILTFAPTRSGKGVGLVVPTLLSWSESAVVTDLKGELWALTAGWRKLYAHNKVVKFEPASPDSVHWNPLDEIRFGQPEVVGDVQNLATLIVDPDGKGLEDHWAKTAYALLTGVILFVLRESRRPEALQDLLQGAVPNGEKSSGSLRPQAMTFNSNKRSAVDGFRSEIKGKISANLNVVDRLLSMADPKNLWETMNINEYEFVRTKLNLTDEQFDNLNEESIKSYTPQEQAEIRWVRANRGINDIIRAAGNDMRARPDEEAGSVLSTAKSFLSLYRDPVVAKNISDSEFRIRDLMYHSNNASMPDPNPMGFVGAGHESAVTLYIVTQPNDKTRLRPLVRILVNMIVRLLASRMEFEDGRTKKQYDHRLLLMLDEFPSLGKLDILQESLAFVSGYGIKAYLITQDLTQLKSKEIGYGEDEAITSNCHIQNAYAPNRIETAEHLSKMAGQTTIVKEEISISRSQSGGLLSNASSNKSLRESQRELLTPDECMRLKLPEKNGNGDIVEPGEMLIFVAGHPAIRGVQPLYFKDPMFSKRAKVKVPESSDRIRQVREASKKESISREEIRSEDARVIANNRKMQSRHSMSLSDYETTDETEAA